ncbi:MAG: CoA transferase [Chloroflexi bacterium]|nr:CoA transferase [Chloroflexota bacterium]
MTEAPGALDDLLAIELSRGRAAGICGRLLAELGARVVKVEPPDGDPARWRQPLGPGGVSLEFRQTHAGKESLTVDLGVDAGRRLLQSMLGQADVFLHDLTVAELEALGLDLDRLSAELPQLLVCAVTPFGLTGPLATRPGAEVVVQALSGIMTTTGFPGDPPTKCGPPLAEYTGAIYGALATLAALAHRDKSGMGQVIDISQHDCLVFYLSSYLAGALVTGKNPSPGGNRHPSAVPWNAYPTLDGHALLCTANDRQWDTVLGVIGRTDLVGYEAYDSLVKRLARVDEIDEIVSAWTCQRSSAEAIAAFEAVGLPAGPIFEIPDLLRDPHFRAREMLIDVGDGGPLVAGSVFKLSETPGRVGRRAPALGEHQAIR